MIKDGLSPRRRILLGLLWLCVLGCSDTDTSLVGPRSPTAQDTQVVVPPPGQVAGCVMLQLHVAAKATAAPIAAPDCGPVQPVVLATTYDSLQRTLILSVAIENHGRLRLHTPSAIRINQGDVPATIQLFGADGHDATGYRWAVASMVPKGGQGPLAATYLPPGARSDTSRTVTIAVPKGVTNVRVTLRAQATIVYGISLRAPKGTPQREFDISGDNVLPRSQLAGGATRDALWLTFKPNATLDEREEALEAVDGTVVGGSILGSPNRYYVRIPVPSKSDKQPLMRAIRTLSRLPQVRFATLDLHSDINAEYLRPKDASAFASWVLARSAPAFHVRRAFADLTQRSIRSHASSQSRRSASFNSRTSRPRRASCSRVNGCPSLFIGRGCRGSGM